LFSDDCVDAFSVFQFTGMLGTSDSYDGSIGGTMKRFAKSLRTGRVVESTMLRSVGFSGCGGGGEHGFFFVLSCVGLIIGDSKHVPCITAIQGSGGSVMSRVEVLRR